MHAFLFHVISVWHVKDFSYKWYILFTLPPGRNSGAEYPDVMPLNEELKTGELAKHETKMLLQD